MKKALFALIIVYLLIYIIPLGQRQIAIIDEARYGEIPREMIDSGDWVVPRLNGMRYFEKPVLGYWMNAFSMLLFGQNAFAIRLPSALAAGGTAILLYFLLLKSTHSRKMALLAAAMSLTFVEACAVGVTSVLDTMLTFFVTGMIVFFYYAYREESTTSKLVYLVTCGVFAFCAFMTKGFLAFAVPVITLVPFLLWQRDWKRVFSLPWVPLLVAFLLILPWALMIHQREADFWSYFFWEEHINRFLPESLNHMMHESDFWRTLLGEKATARLVIRETQHEEAFWYFVPVFIGGALPWSLIMPSAFIGLWKTRRRDPLIRFSLCWLIFPFLFFSASSGKLGTYILPCFPALAILGACGLCRYFGTGKNKAFKIGAYATSTLFALTGLFLLFAYFTGIPEPIYSPAEVSKLIMAVAGAFFVAGFTAWSACTTGTIKRLTLYALAPVLLLFAAHFALPERLAVTESAQDFLETHRERANHSELGVDKYLTHSACFFYGRDDIHLFDSRGEFEYGLSYPDAENRLMTLQRFEQLIRDTNRTKPLVLIIDTDHYDEREEFLQGFKPSYEEIDGKMTILQFD